MFKSNNQKSLLKVIVNGYSHCHGGGNGHSNSHNASHREAGYVALTSVLILSALFVIISVAAFGSSVTEMGNISGSISSNKTSNFTASCIEELLEKGKEGVSSPINTAEMSFDKGSCNGTMIDVGSFGSVLLSEGESDNYNKKIRADVSSFEPNTLVSDLYNYSGNWLINAEKDNTDWKKGESDTQVNTKEEDLKLPEFGNALEFTDNSQYVDISYLPSEKEGTIQFWIKPNWDGDDGNEHNFVRVGDPGDDGLLFRKITSDVLNYETYNNSTCSSGGYCDLEYDVSSWVEGKWYNLAITWSMNKKEIYVNGNLMASKEEAPFTLPTKNISIGRRGSTYPSAHSTMDEVKIYSKALSKEEIRENMYNSFANKPNLVGYWNFNEGAGAVAEDLSPYNNDGAVMNSPAWVSSINKGERTSSPLDLSNVSSAAKSDIDWVDKGGLYFDGIDDYVEIPDDNSLDGMKELTVSAWVKAPLPNEDKNEVVINKGWSSTEKSYNLHYDHTSAGMHFNVVTINGEDHVSAASTPRDGGWHYIVGTYNSNSGILKLYVDGKLNNSKNHSTGGAVAEGTDTLKLGNHSSSFLEGNIDDVRIYERELTAKEILGLYNSAPISSKGLVGHWKLNEGEGTTAYDSSENNNNGTINGDPKWLSTEVKSAVINQNQLYSLNFDGTDDYMKLTDGTILTAPTEITMSSWFYIQDTDRSMIFGANPASYNDYVFSYNTSGSNKLRFRLCRDSDNTCSDIFSSNPLDLNKWYHAVATYDSNSDQQVLYLNGSKVSEATFSRDHDIGNVYAGRWFTSDLRYFNGLVDDLRIYNRVLSQTEVEKLYNQEAVDNGLVGYWPLSEGTGGTAYDQSINSNDGTINGATWSTDSSGAVPGGYHVMEKGDSIPDISRGDDLDSKYLWLRQTLSTEDPFHSPKLEALKVEILGD